MHPVQLTAGSVAIGGRPVLRGIDLTVETGEFVALMGANGSGKSTLVRALTGLLPLASGELRLFGTPLADHEVHHPSYGDPHTHHHHTDGTPTARHDHAPHLDLPVDRR